ncbi:MULTISPECIES: sigma-70 family RNA polymerase sigma factor [unclassified Frondihabitans]|uniref:sigma-70 family RNA polymerase sigma factor n=1 Tax=unclassified Frondihabitans TaxID=2626248 RepID=UPI000F50DD37|nr:MULTISPECIES: sigma-70 family RNA polymerase sigma factor [unclassified Frondihabitans]RPE77525.1 RNA polymerase sigma factor for flagellar operon FliA [Frondihabitans sp. PhB153]RPF07802.1 RNA polymerase sigma factor for flagellar operon FliA [Frondihabitans sp. PhB161]
MNKTERNAMVVQNLPLVGYLVSEVCAKATHLSRDDLASAGALALVQAADAFDPTQGVPFGAYARTRIMGAFADDMRSSDWASRGTRKRIKETLATQETLTAALGRTPNVDEIASSLGVDRKTATDALTDAARTVTAIDETVADQLAADIILPEETLLEQERTRYLRAAVDALPEKMRFIIDNVYFGDRSVTEVADELGITHSAVSQQRTEAIRLLRDGLNTHYAGAAADETAEVSYESRTAPARRAAYLARVASNAVVGIGTAMRESVPVQQTAAAS